MVTKEMCASGFSDKELPLENQQNIDSVDNYIKIETYSGGNPYCGGRYGGSQYLKNTHSTKKIRAEVETIFDNGLPTYNKYTIRPKRRKHIGCTKWQGDGVPPQYYVRQIVEAEFIER